MKLDVLQSAQESPPPWYGGGLRFTCTQCGNCCTGPPGYVWLSGKEIRRLARHLGMTQRDMLQKYCRSVGKRYVLKENRNEHGEYDCIFLKQEKVMSKGVAHTRRFCGIYEVRPLQCRTFPFWEGVLASPEAWRSSSTRCHGMNNGARVFSREEIEALRDAKDWPTNPPGSSIQKRSRS